MSISMAKAPLLSQLKSKILVLARAKLPGGPPNQANRIFVAVTSPFRRINAGSRIAPRPILWGKSVGVFVLAEGAAFWSVINSLKTLTLSDDPNIIPTFHYYDPFNVTHQGADWVTPARP
jgi:hypothetical protein